MTNANGTTQTVYFKSAEDMQEIPSNSVHLIGTSSPYPMIEMWDEIFKSWNPSLDIKFRELKATKNLDRQQILQKEIFEGMHCCLEKVWKECYRVLVNGGILVINIGDAYRKVYPQTSFQKFWNSAKTVQICERLGFISLPSVLWKKITNRPNAYLGSGFVPTSPYISEDCEHILIFRKGSIRQFPPKDLKRQQSAFTRQQRDLYCSQVWSGIQGIKQTTDGYSERTAAFPEEIPKRIITLYSIIGDLILDPFAGTGTTLKVAKDLGRDSVGYEIVKELEPIIRKKLK
jgi:site-specific DNA-methyltransferase (cytosine-N4-specific)